MFCHECEYPADTIYDLGEHMFEFHSEGYGSKMDCHYCEESFETKDSLTHANKVKQCIFFSEGTWEFGNELFWFNHDKFSNSLLEGATLINCNLCDKTFRTRSDFMIHRKHDHVMIRVSQPVIIWIMLIWIIQVLV